MEPPPTFGPYLVGDALGTAEGVEVHRAALFLPDGRCQYVALRRTRPFADGGSDAFLARARRFAMVRHPQVAEVIDLGNFEDRSYIATELVAGHSLLRVLARCGKLRIGFPTDVALYVVGSVLRALDFAHRLSDRAGRPMHVLHGDLSHTNVLLTAEGEVRVTDFEMAVGSTRRRTHRGADAPSSGGYACYMAPEQARGGPATATSDVFMAGILLYELITGHRLFSGSDEQALLDQLAEHRFEVPLRRYRPDLHPGLQKIITTALSAAPERRYATAGNFAAAIDTLLDEVNVHPDRRFVAQLVQRLFGRPEGLEEAT